jgi:hypothetical protein
MGWAHCTVVGWLVLGPGCGSGRGFTLIFGREPRGLRPRFAPVDEPLPRPRGVVEPGVAWIKAGTV